MGPMMPPVGGIRGMSGCLEFIVILIYSILLNYNAIMKVMIKLKEKVKHKI